MRCRIKFLNERNPRGQLLTDNAEDSARTAGASREEGGDDVKSARPLRPGRHTCYNGRYSGKPCGDTARNPKTSLSSDRSLQLDSVKLDSLVIAISHGAVNTFPGLVHTARQAMGVGSA